MGCASSSPANEGGAGAGAAASAKYVAPTALSADAQPQPAKSATPLQNQASTTRQSSVGSGVAASQQSAEQTFLKVGKLLQQIAEVQNPRKAPSHVLKRVLEVVANDCGACSACLYLVSTAQDVAMSIATKGPQVHQKLELIQLDGNSGTLVEQVVRSRKHVELRRGTDVSPDLERVPDLNLLVASPVVMNEKLVAVVMLGADTVSSPEAAGMMWQAYLSLVAAKVASNVNEMPAYLEMLKDTRQEVELDAMLSKLLKHMRHLLGHEGSKHLFYRIALLSSNQSVATLFDDLSQMPSASMRKNASSSGDLGHGGLGSHPCSSSDLPDHARHNIMRSVVNLKSTVMRISITNNQQVVIPDLQKLINQSRNVSVDIFNTRLIRPPTSVLVFPLKLKSTSFGCLYVMSSVRVDFVDLNPAVRELSDVLSPHLHKMLNGPLRHDYVRIQEALAAEAGSGNFGSSCGLVGNISPSGDTFNINMSVGGSNGGSVHGSDSVALAQCMSSTGALITGLTEKLNNKRISSAMKVDNENCLDGVTLTSMLGEGGFGTVFKGLLQGLVVAVKVVVDDGSETRAVIKNAHEVALLSTLSHPHVVQAYRCLSDCFVQSLLDACIKRPSPLTDENPSSLQYLISVPDKLCHVEVMEFCDLGTLGAAIQQQIFHVRSPKELLRKAGDSNGGKNFRPKLVNLKVVVLTLLEIGAALGYMHKMGVVHCDMKPANVLLKSSTNDMRGFTSKVSDFGLSRVQDDEESSLFPCNSCGTVAYVPPEALVCNKKVDSMVDVFAFGIMMWEILTAQKPYGDMEQKLLIEEVVMQGLRPAFPPGVPVEYIRLASACWGGAAAERPRFNDVLVHLNAMLQGIDEGSIPEVVPLDIPREPLMEYIPTN